MIFGGFVCVCGAQQFSLCYPKAEVTLTFDM